MRKTHDLDDLGAIEECNLASANKELIQPMNQGSKTRKRRVNETPNFQNLPMALQPSKNEFGSSLAQTITSGIQELGVIQEQALATTSQDGVGSTGSAERQRGNSTIHHTPAELTIPHSQGQVVGAQVQPGPSVSSAQSTQNSHVNQDQQQQPVTATDMTFMQPLFTAYGLQVPGAPPAYQMQAPPTEHANFLRHVFGQKMPIPANISIPQQQQNEQPSSQQLQQQGSQQATQQQQHDANSIYYVQTDQPPYTTQ